MTDPLTGFEINVAGGGHAWTTLAQEETWYGDLAGGRMAFQSIGSSVLGNDMWLVSVGTGSTHIFIVAQQHGWEAAGREASFQLIRDLTLTTDPTLDTYLENVTWHFMPTCNPDRLNTDRENAAGINLNRDHVQLTQPETQAIHQTITDFAPELIMDLHEGRNITDNSALSPPLNINADAALLTLADDLYDDVGAALVTAGYTWEPYQNNNIVGPEYLHTSAVMRHAIGLLVESRRTDSPNNPLRTVRVDIHKVALAAILAYDQANRSTIASTTAASLAAAITEGDEATVPFELVTGTSSAGTVLDPPPNAYRLTSAQHTEVASNRAILEIASTVDGSDFLVSMAQGTQPLIPYLYDPSSSQRLVSAERVYDDPPTEPPVTFIEPGIRQVFIG